MGYPHQHVWANNYLISSRCESSCSSVRKSLANCSDWQKRVKHAGRQRRQTFPGMQQMLAVCHRYKQRPVSKPSNWNSPLTQRAKPASCLNFYLQPSLYLHNLTPHVRFRSLTRHKRKRRRHHEALQKKQTHTHYFPGEGRWTHSLPQNTSWGQQQMDTMLSSQAVSLAS